MIVSLGKDKDNQDKVAVRIATAMTARFVDIVSPNDESGKYEISVGLAPSAPEVAELRQLVSTAIQKKFPAWQGQVPPGGNDPLANMWDHTKYAEMQGLLKIKATSGFMPVVIDQNNCPLDPSVLVNYLYPGCKVELVVTAWAFDNKAKGAALSVEVIKVVDNTCPRIGGGGGVSMDAVANIFGGGAQMQPAMQAPVQQPAMQAPVQQPAASLAQPAASLASPAPSLSQPAAAPQRVYEHTDPQFTKAQWLQAHPTLTDEQLVAAGKGRWVEQPVIQPAHDFLQQPGLTNA